MTPTAIIILGYCNDSKGRLERITMERIAKGLEVWRGLEGAKILATGAYGRFNPKKSGAMHYEWMLEAVRAAGVPAGAILGGVASGYTLQDATMSLEALKAAGIERAVVVTSDFHRPRSEWLFEGVYAGSGIEVSYAASVPTTVGSWVMAKLLWVREWAYLRRLKAKAGKGK